MSSDQQQPPEPTDAPEQEPLPPLPDGGLARVMPDWLRDEPANAEPSRPSTIDPASLVTADDLPDWLRQLGPEPLPAPAPAAAPTLPSDTMAAVPPPHEQPVTLAIPPAPPDEEPQPTLEPTPALPRDPAIVAPPVLPRPTHVPAAAVPQLEPDMARRKAVVAVLGVLLLVLVVAVYVYARGGL